VNETRNGDLEPAYTGDGRAMHRHDAADDAWTH